MKGVGNNTDNCWGYKMMKNVFYLLKFEFYRLDRPSGLQNLIETVVLNGTIYVYFNTIF